MVKKKFVTNEDIVRKMRNDEARLDTLTAVTSLATTVPDVETVSLLEDLKKDIANLQNDMCFVKDKVKQIYRYCKDTRDLTSGKVILYNH